MSDGFYKPVDESGRVSLRTLNTENHYFSIITNSEIFRVDKFGDVWRGHELITEDEAALAECFREWVKLQTGISVRTIVKDGDA